MRIFVVFFLKKRPSDSSKRKGTIKKLSLTLFFKTHVIKLLLHRLYNLTVAWRVSYYFQRLNDSSFIKTIAQTHEFLMQKSYM